MATPQKPDSALLYVKDKGRVRGPFLRSFIDAMILSGHFSTTIEVSLSGKSDWTRIESPPESKTFPSAQGAEASSPKSNSKNKVIIGIATAAGLGIFLIIAAFNSSSENSSNRQTFTKTRAYSTPQAVVASTPRPVSTPIIPVTPTPSPSIQLATSAEPIPDSSFLGWNDNYKDALEKARASNKKLLIYFSGSNWSPWCRKQKTELLDTPDFQEYARRNLVLLQVDFPSGTNPTSETLSLKKTYKVYGFPSLVLVGANGYLLKNYFGYLPDGFVGFKNWIDSESVEVSNPDISKYSEGISTPSVNSEMVRSGISVSARLPRPSLGSSEIGELQILVSGASQADVPSQISVDGLQITLSGQSTQVQMVNFKVCSTVVYSYKVMPLQIGTFTIPAVTVTADSRQFHTEPLQLNVSNQLNQNPSLSSYSTPSLYKAPPLQNNLSTSHNNQRYSYRQSQSYTLNRLDEEVRSKKQVVASYKQSMDYLDNQIKSDRPYVDRTDQSSLDQFNEKVNRYNNLRIKYNAAIDDLNNSVDRFNAELQRIGTPDRN